MSNTDPSLGVFQILLFMNIGLGCGLAFSALISKYEDSNHDQRRTETGRGIAR